MRDEIQNGNKDKLKHSAIGVASCKAFIISLIIYSAVFMVFGSLGNWKYIFMFSGMPILIFGFIFGIYGIIIEINKRKNRIAFCVIGTVLNALLLVSLFI